MPVLRAASHAVGDHVAPEATRVTRSSTPPLRPAAVDPRVEQFEHRDPAARAARHQRPATIASRRRSSRTSIDADDPSVTRPLSVDVHDAAATTDPRSGREPSARSITAARHRDVVAESTARWCCRAWMGPSAHPTARRARRSGCRGRRPHGSHARREGDRHRGAHRSSCRVEACGIGAPARGLLAQRADSPRRARSSSLRIAGELAVASTRTVGVPTPRRRAARASPRSSPPRTSIVLALGDARRRCPSTPTPAAKPRISRRSGRSSPLGLVREHRLHERARPHPGRPRRRSTWHWRPASNTRCPASSGRGSRSGWMFSVIVPSSTRLRIVSPYVSSNWLQIGHMKSMYVSRRLLAVAHDDRAGLRRSRCRTAGRRARADVAAAVHPHDQAITRRRRDEHRRR